MIRPLSARRAMALAALDEANRRGDWPPAVHAEAGDAVLSAGARTQGARVRAQARVLLALVDLRLVGLVEVQEEDPAQDDDAASQDAEDVLVAARRLLTDVQLWQCTRGGR